MYNYSADYFVPLCVSSNTANTMMFACGKMYPTLFIFRNLRTVLRGRCPRSVMTDSMKHSNSLH